MLTELGMADQPHPDLLMAELCSLLFHVDARSLAGLQMRDRPTRLDGIRTVCRATASRTLQRAVHVPV
ncbi:hypothetical protein [Cellulomonas sp. ATA003]|uniref:hypothetical protein n=1 Tax=Cellulomonas sp. ATA003 TaxID=3073064 RepID=UPI002873D0DD|nr:hypothetical protein [Cellulomonas sp. ATA003]WNB86762.1 hypothetical protein REH70_05985 [Cellulomonas sp. ATA003]